MLAKSFATINEPPGARRIMRVDPTFADDGNQHVALRDTFLPSEVETGCWMRAISDDRAPAQLGV
jgi:hypothetical protein